MSGHGPETPSTGAATGSRAAPPTAASRSPSPAEMVIVERLPVWLTFAFLAALPFPGLINVVEGASVALMVMLLATPIWFEAARARKSPFDRLAAPAIAVMMACTGFLIFWSLISIFDATDPLRASRYIASLIAGFSIYLMIRSTVTRRRLGLYIDVLALGLAASSALSLLGFEIGVLRDIIFRGTDRAAGFFKNPNQFGMAISTTLPVVMALMLSERSRRWLRFACLMLMLLGLLASGSKTNFLLAWGTLFAVLCGHSWICYRGSTRYLMLARSVLGSLAFAVLGVALISVINPRALGIMLEFFSGEGEVDSLLTRSFLWDYSIDQFLADPVMGQGAGQRIDIFYREADVSHSHNVLVDYMRNLGAPGILVMGAMIATVSTVCLMTIVKALRSDYGAPGARLLCYGLSLGCLSYVAANMSSDSFGPSTSPFFWVFAYLAFAARNLMQTPSLVLRRSQWQAAVLARLRRFPDILSQEAYDDDSLNGFDRVRRRSRFVMWLVLLAASLFLALAMLLLGQSLFA